SDLATLSLHDALPIFPQVRSVVGVRVVGVDEQNGVERPLDRSMGLDDVSDGDVLGVAHLDGDQLSVNQGVVRIAADPVVEAPDLDRKSTRLNSSHVKI